MTTRTQLSDRTIRFSDVGLITRADCKFRYARVRPEGKVHIVTYAIIRWSDPPFPDLSYVLACGGRQHRTPIPQRLAAYPEDECCIKCFKLDTSKTMDQLRRREHIFETVEGWDGEFTYRDIWMAVHCTYSLVTLVIMEMRRGNVVKVVSVEGKQPLKMVAVKT